MSLPVFIFDYEHVIAGDTPTLPQVGERLTLSGAEGRHAVAVKRIAVGEEIELIDGTGTRARVVVTHTSGKDRLEGDVVELSVDAPPRLTVTVAQALPKSDRSELTVDLLTQAGVDTIIPWQAHRSVAKWVGAKNNKQQKGKHKWLSAAVAATKQSRRSVIPHITDVHDTPQVVSACADYDLVVVAHENAAVPFSELRFDTVTSVLVIVGPEGGITPEEVAAFSEAGATLIKLGPQVLRTATAGLVTLAAIGARSDRW